RFQSKTRSSTPRPPREHARDQDCPDKSDRTNHGAPHQAATHRVAHRGAHHLVDADRGTSPGQRRTLGCYVSARAGTDLVILYGEEHDNGGSQRGEDETDSHDPIIGRGRSATRCRRGASPRKYQRRRATSTTTRAAITHGIFERRRLNNDSGGGGATLG